MTTYEKFLEGKYKDTYNCVMLCMLEEDLSVDDLEMQQAHFDYYSTVPVVNIAILKSLTELDQFQAVLAFVRKNFEDKLEGDHPVEIEGNVEKDASNMMQCIDEMHDRFEKKV